MQIHKPMIITSRLLPGIRIGNAEISIEPAGETQDGRNRFRWYWDHEKIECSETDLKSRVGGCGIEEMMESLLGFMAACGESYGYAMRRPNSNPENLDLFPEQMHEWCYLNSDELSMLGIEIEEARQTREETEEA